MSFIIKILIFNFLIETLYVDNNTKNVLNILKFINPLIIIKFFLIFFIKNFKILKKIFFKK